MILWQVYTDFLIINKLKKSTNFNLLNLIAYGYTWFSYHRPRFVDGLCLVLIRSNGIKMIFFWFLEITTRDVDVSEQTQKEKEKESAQDKATISVPPSEHDEFDDQMDNVAIFFSMNVCFFSTN